jgi:type I restriction enzyme S subunit
MDTPRGLNLVPFGSDLSKFFFKRLIESPYFTEYALKKATGTTIKNLGLKAMNNLPIALPPVEEQKRIADKVDEFFSLCEILTSRLKDARKAQLQLATSVVDQAVA